MNTETRAIRSIELNAFGTTDLSQPIQMRKVLEAIESDPKFAPDSGSTEDGKRQAYDRERMVEFAEHRGMTYENRLYLAHKRATKYSGYIMTGKKPSITVEFDRKMPASSYHKLFSWADRVMRTFKPDYASLSIYYQYDYRPWPTKLDEYMQRFSYSSSTVQGTYYRSGPAGVGLYTWIGRHFIDQIGRDFLMQTPNTVTEMQDWDGVRLSLGNTLEPWLLDPEGISVNWEPAMQHLWEKDIFAEQYVDEDGALRREKGSKSVIGGVLPDS